MQATLGPHPGWRPCRASPVPPNAAPPRAALGAFSTRGTLDARARPDPDMRLPSPCPLRVLQPCVAGLRSLPTSRLPAARFTLSLPVPAPPSRRCGTPTAPTQALRDSCPPCGRRAASRPPRRRGAFDPAASESRCSGSRPFQGPARHRDSVTCDARFSGSPLRIAQAPPALTEARASLSLSRPLVSVLSRLGEAFRLRKERRHSGAARRRAS